MTNTPSNDPVQPPKKFPLSMERLFYLLCIVLILVGSLIGWHYWDLIQGFLNEYSVSETVLKYAEYIEDWTQRFGFFGWLIIVLINVLQIVIAFLPGEPVELATGVLYGGFWGAVLCVIGVVIGETIVFKLTRRYGVSLVNRIFRRDVQEMKIFQDEERLEAVTFVLFLLPGTPKDVLTYVAGLSKISIKTFLGITVLARFPSIISSTIIGGSAISGDFTLTYWAVVITTILGFVGILLKDPVMNWIARRKKLMLEKLQAEEASRESAKSCDTTLTRETPQAQESDATQQAPSGLRGEIEREEKRIEERLEERLEKKLEKDLQEDLPEDAKAESEASRLGEPVDRKKA